MPVIVRGPWDDLTFAPDLESVARRALEDPEAVREQIEQLGQGAEGVRDAIKEGGAGEGCSKECWVGQGGGAGESGQGGQGADAARKLLKGLFGN